jgi:peptidyl-prolyl cis-trans isomerase C
MQRITRIALILTFVLAIGEGIIFAQDPQKSAEPQQPAETQKTEAPKEAPKSGPTQSEAVAKVNDQTITTEQLNFFLDRILTRLKARNNGQELPLDQTAKIRKDLITRLVTQEVIFQKAQTEGVIVFDEEVNAALSQIQAQGTDIAPDKLKPLVARNLLVDKFVQQSVISKIDVNDKEAKDFYDGKQDQFKHPEEIKASHILIRVDPNAPSEKKEEAKKKITQILDDAKTGKDFTELAKVNSEEPGAKESGGDLGFFGRGVMAPAFEDAAFSLKPGELSSVVETQFGFHIIKLMEKRDAGITPFSEVKEDIKANLKQERIKVEVSKWIDQLKAQAKIEIMEEQK